MAQLTRGQVNDLIAGFALKDPQYLAALKRDPKKVLAAQLNQQVPESLKVVLVEDKADTVHLVLPYVPKEGQELSDADLEAVAGGKGKGGGGGPSTVECNDARGGFMTYIMIETSMM